MNRTIEIIVSPTGETSLQTKGFAGQACRDASGSLEATLGPRTGEHFTAEFHQTVDAQQAQQQRT